MKNTPADAHRLRAQGSFHLPALQQVFREDRVQVEEGVAVVAELFRLLDEELDGRLVIENHERLLLPRGVIAAALLEEERLAQEQLEKELQAKELAQFNQVLQEEIGRAHV